MEALLVLAGLGVVAYFLAVPLAALALALRSSQRAKALADRVEALEQHVARLERLERRASEAVAPPVKEPVRPAEPAPAPVPAPAAAPAAATAAASAPAAATATATAPASIPVSASVPASAPVSAPAPSLEERIALTWLTRAGAATFLLGALFFFKYAVDNAWIGPAGRVAIGVVTGVVLLVVAEVARPKTRASFVHALSGIGLATIVASIWTSVALYHLVPVWAAFVAAALVLVAGAALSLRHRAEPLLVLVLVAGLSNPVVLSTGKDNPSALFTYLFLLGTVTLGVSLRARFRIAPALAVPGTAALFVGWYSRYFDVHGPYAGFSAWMDLPPEARVGPYHAVSARLVPLAAVALFSAQWAAFAWQIHRRKAEKPSFEPQGFALAALVLSHVGATMLLYDHAGLLSAVAIGLGVASIALLSLLEAKRLLVVPMAAAFVSLLVVGGDAPAADRLLLVALFGAWTAVYVAGFLVDLLRRDPLPAKSAIAPMVATSFFQILAAQRMLPDRPALFVAIAAVASGLSASLAARARSGVLLLATVLFSTLLLEIAAAFVGSQPEVLFDPAFLAAGAALVSVQLVVFALMSSSEKIPVRSTAVVAAAMTSLAFVAALIVSTSGELSMARALLSAAVGAVDLGLAALVVRRRPATGDRLLPLAGLALGLFAAAFAFALSGATVTVLWAALGCVAAAIAARSRAWGWLVVSSLLFAATMVRLVGFDVLGTQALVDDFWSSQGRLGLPAVPVLRNARATALAGTSVALLVASFLLAKGARSGPGDDTTSTNDDSRGPLGMASGVAAIGGHALWIALAIVEVRALATTRIAAPPVPLDWPEWAAFSARYHDSIEAQQGRLAMITTLVLSASAAALLSLGFAARSALHRYLGLTLFLLAVLKLALWDVWSVERIYQIVLLTGVGALLVGGGFLYARYGERILALMRTGKGGPPAGGAAALVVLLLLSPRVSAEPSRSPLSVSRHASMRVVSGVSAPGDFRLSVDEPLYRASTAAELFGDVRIVGPEGLEVPYIVRPSGSSAPVNAVAGSMTDPSRYDDGSASATFHLPPGTSHCRVRLDIRGGSFLRKARIETGDARQSLGVVAEGPFVYRIENDGGSVELLEVPYPRSEASYVRVTLLPSTSAEGGEPVSIRGASFVCPSPAEVSSPVQEVPLVIEEVRRDETQKTTIVTLDAGAEGLLVQAISLDIATPELSRRVTVSATSFREVWPAVGGGMLYRITPRPEVVLESLRLPIRDTRKRWFQLTIFDEDSAPLVLRGARAEVRRREIVFRASAAGEHRLFVGDAAATSPSYDLAAILDRAPRESAPVEATFGPVLPNPGYGKEVQSPALPFTERHRAAVGVVMTIVLLGLSLWAVRLLRSGGGGEKT